MGLKQAGVSGALLSALWVAGCSESGSDSQDAAASQSAIADEVLTTFYPTTFFAERIADGLVPAENPIADLGDPASARPDAETIARYQAARVVVVNGADFEAWVKTAPLPRSRVVDASASFEDQVLTYETRTHAHGEGGEHTHEGIDGHTWMDPALAIEQVEAIEAKLSAAFPEHAEAFEANAAGLAVELRSLREAFQEVGASLEGVTLLSNHPAYAYPSAAYAWGVVDLDLDPEADVAGPALAAVSEAIEGRDGRFVLMWESEPKDVIADALRTDLGVESIVFSPVESVPESGDFLTEMRANVERLLEAIE